MRAPDMQTEREIAKCPVCAQPIKALIITALTVEDQKGAVRDGIGSVSVAVTPTIERLHLRHDCMGRTDAAATISGAPEYPRQAP